MSSVRLRRLQSDYEQLAAFVRRQPRVRLIQTQGRPPEQYQLEYHLKSIRQVDDELQMVNRHLVEISLPRNYPRTPPQCRMLTPIFHPNVAPHAICIGDHWSAGEPLWSMVARIGEIIAYQSYNTKSPLNGEAARWVDENEERLPLDRAPIYVEQPSQKVAGRPKPPSAAPAAKPPSPAPAAPRPSPAQAATQPSPAPTAKPTPARETTEVRCPGCGAAYRVPVSTTAQRARCKRCQALIVIPSQSATP